ncbi:MAG: 4-alpha-glucanotransferase [Marinoscillum sp.]|jgi:4-alpha-glucanotransferase
MKLKFVVGYRTHYGQSLFVTGSIASLGAGDSSKAVKLSPSSGDLWEGEIEIKFDKRVEFTYHYFLKDEQSGATFHEFGKDRQVEIDASYSTVRLRDFWRTAKLQENSLYTAPFEKAFFVRGKKKMDTGSKTGVLKIQMRAPRISKDYQLGIIGSLPALGSWDDSKALLMGDEDFPTWSVDIPLAVNEVSFEYKYVIYSHKENRVVTWENGDNRYFPLLEVSDKHKKIIHTDENFRYPVGNWKTSGVAIPIFSLRSNEGAGVGEFTDIKKLVDWSVKTGLKVIQVLPVNDTVATHTWVDSYPYAAISVQALHPIYANLQAFAPLKNKSKEIFTEAAKLNQLVDVDYESVMKLKTKFFKLSFDENKASFLSSKEFKQFLKANEAWLLDYAAFSYLRDKHGTPDFTQWGKNKFLKAKELIEFVSPTQPHYDDVAIYYYIQYHLDSQLKDATAYARQHGVVLKGDIPIGIYRNSVDAWRLPHLFNMDTQAGAPPDDFSISGQNWGFPTYNWDEMAKDGYKWWKERMVKMSDYFDVFRIDHILGFFRIWEIPYSQVEGLMGSFNPALPFSKEELEQWGIHFDEDRLCKPYIRRHMLYDIFGNHAESIMEEYLDEYSDGCFNMKADFDTQRKVKVCFDGLNKRQPETEDFNNWIRYNLYSIISEVIFLSNEKNGNDLFNPRIGFHSTYSYSDLDPQQKQRLNDLYTHYFYKRHNDFWRESAMEKLPMLKDATDMLICGEDLGMVPASVPGVMDDLQILSLAIQRMPNDDREFWHPSDTPYMSVTSTGSHDMSTLREWWQEDAGQTQRFYNSILGLSGEAPYFCEPWVAKEVINQHLHSPSMLAIFPLQDLIAMDGSLRQDSPEKERINVPANPQHYWKYRFHISMEDLLQEEGFNSFLRQLIDQGGRSADY